MQERKLAHPRHVWPRHQRTSCDFCSRIPTCANRQSNLRQLGCSNQYRCGFAEFKSRERSGRQSGLMIGSQTILRIKGFGRWKSHIKKRYQWNGGPWPNHYDTKRVGRNRYCARCTKHDKIPTTSTPLADCGWKALPQWRAWSSSSVEAPALAG